MTSKDEKIHIIPLGAHLCAFLAFLVHKTPNWKSQPDD